MFFDRSFFEWTGEVERSIWIRVTTWIFWNHQLNFQDSQLRVHFLIETSM